MYKRTQIKLPILMVVSDILSEFYTTSALESLFLSNGAPKLYESSKVKLCRAWFNAINSNLSIDPIKFLSTIVSDFMEYETTHEEIIKAKDKINRTLNKYNLFYQTDIGIISGFPSISVTSLRMLSQADDKLSFISEQIRTATLYINSNSCITLTDSCSIVESLLKFYIEDNKLDLPENQGIRQLWKVVQKDLKLRPQDMINTETQSANQNLLEIVSGLTSIINGLGGLRSNAGNAHGRSKSYKIESRHATLAINSASALCTFIIQVIEKRRKQFSEP